MTGIVYFSFCVSKISGMNKLFQLATKAKMACVATAGIISGRMIRLKVLNSPEPSTRAASTISIDSVASRYWRMKNTTAGAAIAGRISGRKLFVQCILYMN
ncbi:hypothetical protein D3C75_1021710 [compost metagenome]